MSGLKGQLVAGAESTYSTPVTPARAFELRSEGIEQNLLKIDAPGIRNRRVLGAARTKTYVQGHSGPIVMDVLSKGFGYWFDQMLGSTATSGAGAAKTHKSTIGTNGNVGKYGTVQVGRPTDAGTVVPFTYEGVKVNTWELNCGENADLQLTLGVLADDLKTNTSLVTPSYTAGSQLFSFAECGITLGGDTLYARSVKVAGDNKLESRWFLGNVGKEPIPSDWAAITGELDMDWTDLAWYNDVIVGTQEELIITFLSPDDIPSSSPLTKFTVKVTIPKVEFLEAKPKLGGPELIKLAAPWRALDDLTNAPITIDYITTDATP